MTIGEHCDVAWRHKRDGYLLTGMYAWGVTVDCAWSGVGVFCTKGRSGVNRIYVLRQSMKDPKEVYLWYWLKF